MPPNLLPDLNHRASLKITDQFTVPGLSARFSCFESMPPVFATAMMIGFIESTCIECIRMKLSGGRLTLGTKINLNHIAPTPVGLMVTADVKLAAVDGRKLYFEIDVWDDEETICKGTHERMVIDKTRFLKRIRLKASKQTLPDEQRID